MREAQEGPSKRMGSITIVSIASQGEDSWLGKQDHLSCWSGLAKKLIASSQVVLLDDHSFLFVFFRHFWWFPVISHHFMSLLKLKRLKGFHFVLTCTIDHRIAQKDPSMKRLIRTNLLTASIILTPDNPIFVAKRWFAGLWSSFCRSSQLRRRTTTSSLLVS